MKTPAPPAAPCWLLPRICDTARLRLDGKCAPVHVDLPLPPDACFISGNLCGCPFLQDICLSTQPNGCGTMLRAELHLPVSLCFTCGCEHIVRTGSIHLELQAALRVPCVASMHILPQAELCIRSAFPQNSCLQVEFDLRLCLYAVQLQPVQLPASCPEPPQPDCAPYFHLPLYPELPPRKM